MKNAILGPRSVFLGRGVDVMSGRLGRLTGVSLVEVCREGVANGVGSDEGVKSTCAFGDSSIGPTFVRLPCAISVDEESR